MEDKDKRTMRTFIKSQVLVQKPLYEVKDALSNLIPEKTFWSASAEHYIVAKYIKYCRQELSLFAKVKLENATFPEIHEFSRSLLFPDLRIHHDCKILGSSPFAEHINNVLELCNDDEKGIILGELRRLLVPEVIDKGDSSQAETDLAQSSELLSIQEEYLLDYKTQFLITDIPTVFNMHSLEQFDSDWTQFAEKSPDIEQEVTTKHNSLKLKAISYRKQFELETKTVLNHLILQVKWLQTPVKVAVTNERGRKILTVEKPVLVLSKCLQEVETKLSNDNSIHEIRFYTNSTFYADKSLENKIWHAKNVIVNSKVFCCVLPNIAWNVSGSNGDKHKQARANDGEEPGADGQNGSNGYPGESGGNVGIISEINRNMEYLTISTNGGNGSDGQHGGDGVKGANGENGYALDRGIIEQRFPNPVRLWFTRKGALQEIISNLLFESSNIEKKFVGISELPEILNRDLSNNQHVNNDTKTGGYVWISGFYQNELKFEFCYSEWTYGSSVYLLFKGTRGRMGSDGGKGGMGGLCGKGGYHGDVTIINHKNVVHSGEQVPRIKSSSGSPGTNGINGKEQPRGDPGRNGFDAGYADVNWWRNPEYFSTGYYHIIDNSNHQSHRVWCNRYRIHRSIVEYRPEKLEAAVRTRSMAIKRTVNQTAAQKQTAIDIQQELSRSVSLEISANASSHELFKCSQVAKQQWESSKENLLRHQKTATRNTQQFIHCQQHENPRRKYTFKETEMPSSGSMIVCSCELSKKWMKDNPDFQFSQKLSNIKQRHRTIPKMSYWKLSTEKSKSELFLGKDTALQVLIRNEGTSDSETLSATQVRTLSVDKAKIGIECENGSTSNKFILKVLGNCLHARIQQLKRKVESSIASSSEKEKKDYDQILKDIQNSKFNWTYLLDNHIFRNILSYYFKLMADTDVILTIDELRLIAYCFGNTLVVCEKDSSGRYTPNEPVADSGQAFSERKMKLELVYKEDGAHTVLTDDYVRDWVKVENCQKLYVSNYLKNDGKDVPFCKPHHVSSVISFLNIGDCEVGRCSKLLTIWPPNKLKLFHDIVVEKNIDHTKITQLMFEILSQKMLKQESDAPWMNILLSYDPEHWALEICHALLEERCSHLQPTKTDIEAYHDFLEHLPSQMLQHLAVLIHANASKYCTEMSDSALKEQLEILVDDFPWLKRESDLEILDGMMTISQWRHQIGKTAAVRKIKELVSCVNWDEEESKLNNTFYYYYSLRDTETSVESVLEIYNEKVQSSQMMCEEVPLWWILRQFHSGKWKLTCDVLQLFAKSTSVDAFVDEMKSKEQGTAASTYSMVEIIKASTLNTLGADCIHVAANIFNKELVNNEVEELNEDTLAKDMRRWRDEWTKLVNCGAARSQIAANAIRQIDKVIKLKFGHNLRHTQKFAILLCTVLEKDKEQQNSFKDLLLQVNTGEGKSYIVMATAIVRGLLGQTCDIITCSSILAQRDANKFREVYELFGLEVGTVTSENIFERTREYTKKIVYGEASQFQRDYLLDHFYSQNVRGSRKFETTIIDEVDSMFLDKGNDVLYLSHSPAGLESLDIIFSIIWKHTVQMLNGGAYQPLEIYDSVISSIYPKLFKSDLDSFENPNEVWDFLIKSEAINLRGSLTATPEQIHDLTEKLLPISPNSDINSKFTKLLEERSMQFSNGTIMCASFLKPFVELHLLTWIKSAYQATQYTQGVEYVLHTDYFSSTNDKDPNIVIIDLHTGTHLRHTQWGNGLHQFLQLKHGCKLSCLSMKSVFISNITFFNHYGNLVGLTGTLGSDADRNFLTETYGVDLIVIPTALPSKFIEEEPIDCSDSHNWHEQICLDVQNKIKTQRSVLVICANIMQAEKLHKYICSRKIMPQKCISLYRRDCGSFSKTIHETKIKSGTLIISTNLSGRGADFVLTNSLNDAGGLHVIFSYIPNNTRIRGQGFGRSARNGDRGSGRIIFVGETNSNGGSHQQLCNAIDYLNEKDQQEMERISEIIKHRKNVVSLEEQKFNEFREQFDKVCKTLEEDYKLLQVFNHSVHLEKVKDIVKQNILDRWAFYLDRYSTNLLALQNPDEIHINQLEVYSAETKEIKKEFEVLKRLSLDIAASTKEATKWTKLGMFPSQFEQRARQLVSTPPMQTKLGLVYIEAGKYDEAMDCFSAVTSKEAKNSFIHTAACYAKLFCQMKSTKKTHEEIKSQTLEIRSAIKAYSTQQILITKSSTETYKMRQQGVVITRGLQNQKEAVFDMTSGILSSMDIAFGKIDIEPEDFLDLVDDDIIKANILFQELLAKRILKRPKIADSISEEKVKMLVLGSHLPLHRLQSALHKYKKKELYPEILTGLKKDLNIPDVDDFWSNLTSIFDYETEFVLSPETNLGEIGQDKIGNDYSEGHAVPQY